MSTFSIDSVYSFDVYPGAILGTTFKNVKVEGIINYDAANREIDCAAMHINVYSFLPSGSPNNPKAYNYVKVKTATGESVILGLPWIKLETVTLVENKTIKVSIANTSTDDVIRIRNILAQSGFSNFTITIE